MKTSTFEKIITLVKSGFSIKQACDKIAIKTYEFYKKINGAQKAILNRTKKLILEEKQKLAGYKKKRPAFGNPYTLKEIYDNDLCIECFA